MVIVLVIFLLVQPAGLFADIYQYIDDDGTICFTDSPPKGKKTIPVYSNLKKGSPKKNTRKDNIVLTSYRKPVPFFYENLAIEIAREHSLDPNLIKAVITAESNWDPFAVSKKGAMGLMQLMPSTAQLLNVKNPYDPEENIRAGIRYLKYLLEKFDGDIILAIAAYNAGPTIVEKFGRIPPINETLQYVTKVLHLSGYSKRMELKPPKKKKEEIYMIKLSDGSVLYTNSGISSHLTR
ncbi:MAG: lytic transglycosylase domain-containing protein [Thermodesulfovibrionales bacterium]|nr:lytic transglycosylase domain-containing protein [Thermodesulfovibrionales bacterium]